MNNKKWLKIVDIIFIIIFISKVIFNVLNQLPELITELSFNKIYILLFIGFCIIKTILSLYWFIGIYVAIKIAYKKYYKEKLDKIDLKNDTYYREIIYKNSPGVLSYIDDFKVEEKDIVATLMSLELKQKIKIEDKIILLNENEDNLDENEKYILQNIKNNTIGSIDVITFKNKIISDCLSHNFLKKNDNKKKNYLIYFIIYFVLILLFIILINWFSNIESSNMVVIMSFIGILLFIGLTIFIYPFVAIIYWKSYNTMKKLNPYVRSKKAKDINIKLEGLRKYIENYSLLKDKEYKDLIMWENYLIYSVFLGLNEKIVKEIINKLKT